MTIKEVDEKFSVHRSTIGSESNPPASSATATSRALASTQARGSTGFINCPLFLWKVHILTTKTAGNKRIDQDKIAVEFATILQRPNETLSDYHHRMLHIVESFEMLGLEKPASATQAMRFIQGLGNARYSSMQTSFANELHNELYPTDPPTAVLKASRWMVSGKSTQDSPRALAATKGGKDGKGAKDEVTSKAPGEDKAGTKCLKEAQATAIAAAAERNKRPQARNGLRWLQKATGHLTLMTRSVTT
jgi:hypothetical protein